MTNALPFRLIVLVAVALAIGCTGGGGPPLAPVSGIVTLDGQPVEGAGLEFIADAGGGAYGKTDAGGRYYLSFGSNRTGALLGKNLVRITAGDKVTVGGKKFESIEVFPRKYNVETEQVVEVVKGNNQFDFACESGGFKARQAISSGGN